MAKPIVTPEERFMQRVQKQSNGCWLWTGPVGSCGYGIFHPDTKRCNYVISAHRYSFSMHVSAIPVGLRVLHRCDVTACVCPQHLFLGTQQQNLSDMAIKGRGQKSRSGLPYGVQQNRRVKLVRPFTAVVKHHGKSSYLGSYSTADEAHAVAVAFRYKVHLAELDALEGTK